MKQLLLLLLTFSLSVSNAENPGERKITTLNQLMTVNQEWIKQPECNQVAESVHIPGSISYTDLISIHLMLVEKTLRARDCSSLSAEQEHNRFALLDKLNSYWENKVFPVNDYVNYKTPVFIDRIGTHCAVGYLMQQSGAESLAKEINSKQKFAYVSEIKVKGVTDWANKNGFTLGELAWIQPGYSPYTPTNSLDSGLNASVNVIVPAENFPYVVYAGGSFTKSISGKDCNHIAAWSSAKNGFIWSSLGDGLNGDVNAILLHNNQLIIGGDFKAAGSVITLHVAVYDLQSQQWQPMGGFNNIVRALALYNGEIYAAGDFIGNVAKWNGTSWETINVGLTGSVRTLEVWNSLLVIGGDFELTTGALRKHAVAYDGTQMVLMGFGTKTPVNDFEIFNDTLYAGCDYAVKGDTCGVAKFKDGEWVNALENVKSDFLYFNSVKQLKAAGDRLYMAGDFFLAGLMFYGRNLISVDKTFSSSQPIVDTDSTIKTLCFLNNEVYFGGDFKNNTSWLQSKKLNHIGSFHDITTAVPHQQTFSEIKIYPNPSANLVSITLSSREDAKTLRVYNSLSQIVYEKDISLKEEIEIKVPATELPNGIYSLILLSDKKRASGKFVVQH